MKYISSFLVSLGFLFSEEVDLALESNLLATMANDPSSLVDGKVSAITGEPCLASRDLVIQGAEPIHFTRYYLPGEEADWNLAWDFARAYQAPDASYRWVVCERGESPLIYKKERTVKIGQEIFIRYIPSRLNKGISNTSTGKISSRTNPLNNYILVDEKFKTFTVHRADGTIRSYKKVYHNETDYKLLSEHLPNGNWIFYEYQEIPIDKKNFRTVLSRIYTTNPSRDKTYAAADFQYSDPVKSKSFIIKGSDGQILRYAFNFDGKKSSPLVAVSSTQTINQGFQYLNYKNKSGTQQRLHRVLFPLNREFKFEYYGKDEEIVAGKNIKMDDSWGIDKRRNRVKTLSTAISGDNGHNVVYQTTHSFIYHLNREFRKVTSVFDCENNLTEYLFANDLRLWELKRYSKDKQLLNFENCLWGDEKLLWRAFYDGSGAVLHSKRYYYDSIGNVLEEKFFGNLSGKGPSLILNHLGESTNGAECFIKRCRYSDGRPSLLLEEQDVAGKRIVYDYLFGTDLLVSKLIYDNERLICRKFFEYNDDHILIREIEDDGDSLNPANLTGVEARTIRKIISLFSGPFVGMPHIIEDHYLENSKEHLLKKTVLTYTTCGQIAQQDIFDSDNRFKYSLKTAYDEKGRVIEQTNALGQVEKFSYDECGNRISSQAFSGRTIIKVDYDNLNLPFEEWVRGDDGIALSSQFGYDGRHNLITETDSKGNVTRHVYDSLNRRIQTTLPPIPGENRTLYTPTTRHDYDALGNEILRVDACGNATKISFNSYGKPIAILHPDGAQEEYIYNLDGSLKTSVDPMGIATSFEYDGLGRILSKTISAKGQTLSEERFEYRGMRLTSKTDPEGNRTAYTYDGAGRKIAEECAGETILYQYDSLGRVNHVRKGDLCQVTEYDLLDRVIEERKESPSGELFRKVRYEYDDAGNRIASIRSVAGQEAKEQSRYDSLNRLIEKTDPLSNTESIRYNDHFIDAWSIRVLQKIHTDPMGLKTIETYDAQTHLARIEKRKEKPLAVEEKTYTPNGYLSFQVTTVFSPDGSTRTFNTRWKYDSRGRMAALTEADGTVHAKTTLHSYTLRGELAQTTKPNRINLIYRYDDLGCLTSLDSSDGTVQHTMAYDRLGRLRVLDGMEHTLDAQGRLLSENFKGGYSIENEYDTSGRRVECKIPLADCLVEYGYDGMDLERITRKTLSGTTLFTHSYLDYDLSGHSQREDLIGGKGTVRHTIDPLGRASKIEAPNFFQEINEFDPVGNIRRMRIQNDEMVYQYDDLYQLTSESGHEYLYDSLYNRLEKDREKYEINPLNQIVSHLEYDQNGNPVLQGERCYTYDALDRLIRVETPEYIQSYTYDFLHRCLSKMTLRGREQAVQHFLYDGMNEIGSFNESLQPMELRILGNAPHAEIGAAIAIEVQGKAYAPIHDLQGNLAALLPLDGEAPIFYRFTAFGEETANGSLRSPWRFSSKRTDEQTGLVNFGRRFYSPEFGRWMTPDPAGFTDGMNLYAFVHNDPLSHFDEYGLLSQYMSAPSYEEIHRMGQPGYAQGKFTGAHGFIKDAVRTSMSVVTHMSRNDELMTAMQADLFSDRSSRTITRAMTQCFSYICPPEWNNPNFKAGYDSGYRNAEVATLLATDGVGLIKGAAKGAVSFFSRRALNFEKFAKPILGFPSKGARLNPFKGKSFEEIDFIFRNRQFNTLGPDPLKGKGSYFHPETGRRYYLDHAGKTYRGNVREMPHVDVYYKNHAKGIEKKRLTLGDHLYEFE